MTEDPHSENQPRPRSRRKLWTALGIAIVVLALFIVPPYISINRYKSRITELVATALQRPVRLSGVELRALPRPGFVITDLSVQADPAFGAEPVLHANTVVADIRLWPLWRGKLQISRISVDEASLNLVHMPDGRWNMEDLFYTAAARQKNAGSSEVSFPYLEATNSRINVNDGIEKLPFSIVNADASLWQESGGAWRMRLRGQPARTDVSLDLADTGIVRLEATLHPASRLEQMPLHLDLDWREAQLGQLSRLLLGSDEGWRGDLTGELHLDGTVESAKVTSRLRASGVHRAEFAPAAPLDFDASCSFVFHSSPGSLQKLLCDSPIGDGRARVTGDIAVSGQTPDLTIALDRIPAQAGLDILRTLRSDIDPGLQAAGTLNGTLNYQPPASSAPNTTVTKPRHAGPNHAVPGPLTGSLSAQGVSISGGPLSRPVEVGKILLQPAPQTGSERPALATTVTIPAGAPAPLTLNLRLAVHGFQLGVHGTAALPRLRELAQAAGFSQVQALSQIAGAPAVIDMTAEGPWLPSILPNGNGSMTGTIALKDASWRSGFLAGPVLISAATLHFENGSLNWDPVAFTFGPVKGTATLQIPQSCDLPADCPPHFTLHFASLDAAALQAALLGAHERGTLLSSLLARLRPSAPLWPRLDGAMDADTVDLAPFTLHGVTADLHILPASAEITSFHASVLGGNLSAIGSVTAGDKPSYKLDGDFTQLNPSQAGQLFGMKWTGGAIDGSGHLEMAGFSAGDFASSATGTLHFDWRHGSIASITESPVPVALTKFDRWTADASIAHGAISLGKNEVMHGAHASSVAGSAEFGTPAPVTFGTPTHAKAAGR